MVKAQSKILPGRANPFFVQPGEDSPFRAHAYVAAMARSGSTLLCNLLTDGHAHWLISEPRFDFGMTAKHLAPHAVAFGLVGAEPDWLVPSPQRTPGRIHERYRTCLAPGLSKLQRWGAKEVRCELHDDTIRTIRPDRIVVCVRDIGDIYLSLLEKAAVQGNEDSYDKNWARAHCLENATWMRAYCKNSETYPIIARYEDFAKTPTERERLAKALDWPLCGDETGYLQTLGRGFEVERHARQRGLTQAHMRGLDAEALREAGELREICREYQELFGYDTAGQSALSGAAAILQQDSQAGVPRTEDSQGDPAALARHDPLDDRELLWAGHFAVEGLQGHEPLDPERVKAASGRVTATGDYIRIDFSGEETVDTDGTAISRMVHFALPNAPLVSGYGMRLRLRGWKSLTYIAIGHPEANVYRHVKATNAGQERWFDFDIGFQDIAWGWRNGWQYLEDRSVEEVRFYIKGVPGPEAGCDLAAVRIWQEVSQPVAVFGEDRFINSDVKKALFEYQRLYFPDFMQQARAFMDEGLCPLAGKALLDWAAGAELPARLNDNGTWQYSWHSLHPAVMLMLLAEYEGAGSDRATAALMAARDLVNDWLVRDHERPEANVKYAWYDHGVAERVLTLLMLYSVGQSRGFDVRIMARLRLAILRHGRLLASEAFYAGHQPTRYHNHAWFQDLALIAIGLVFPGWTCASRWVDVALERILDQFGRLIVTDGDFAVFAENSVGYHFGIERLVASIGSFAALSDRDTPIAGIVAGLSRFSALIRYPDGKRALGQGDTFRLPNRPEGDPGGKRPLPRPVVAVLPRAGYAVAKANHGPHPFMLVFLATSQIETHKHADNLSFTLYLDGIEWLIDPSFLSHEYVNPVPAYLRSAPAHNALVLPGQHYAITPGLAQLRGDTSGSDFVFEGTHDAVAGLRFARRITGSLEALRLEVADQMYPAADGGQQSLDLTAARLMFHCGEGVEAEALAGEDGVELRHPASKLRLRIDLPPGCRIALIRDCQNDPIRGIAGQGFLQQVAITTIEVTLPADATGIDWRLWAE